MLILICLSTGMMATGFCEADSSVMINKSKIFFHTAGKGKTAVIFIAGLGEDHSTWIKVQDSIAQLAFTLSYDRAGLGKSEFHDERKDLDAMVAELRSLLNVTTTDQSIILVGHSLGCQIARQFATRYPLMVSGLVLIDPGYNEDDLKKSLPDSVWRRREAVLKQYMPNFSKAQGAERANLNSICRQVDTNKTLLEMAVVLFTATKINPKFPGSKAELEVKQDSHAHWLEKFQNGVQVFVPGSRHYVQNDAPEIVIKSIQEMLRKR